jgi:AcrR family transcriptional regulator
VAVGTIYHHFGTKETLLEAVVDYSFEELTTYMKSLLAEPDPWTGVAGLLGYLAEAQVRDRTIRELLKAHPPLGNAAVLAKRALAPYFHQILERAQQHGQMRADVVAGDIPRLMAGLPEEESATDARQRYLDIILTGLRTDPNIKT